MSDTLSPSAWLDERVEDLELALRRILRLAKADKESLGEPNTTLIHDLAQEALANSD